MLSKRKKAKKRKKKKRHTTFSIKSNELQKAVQNKMKEEEDVKKDY